MSKIEVLSALSLALIATVSSAQADPQVQISPFRVELAVENFPVERFTLALSCSGIPGHFVELGVEKISDTRYVAKLDETSTITIPSSETGPCSYGFSAFTTAERGHMLVRADSALLGALFPLADMTKLDLAKLVEERLSTATLVGVTLADYPYMNASFRYVDRPEAEFCLRALGRVYKSPISDSIYTSISLGEMRTMRGDLSGKVPMKDNQGASALYYRCDNATQSLNLDLPDLRSTEIFSTAHANGTATFNKDLSVMTLRTETTDRNNPGKPVVRVDEWPAL